MCNRAQKFSSTFFKNKMSRILIHFPARSGRAPGARPRNNYFSQLCEPWQSFTYHVVHIFLRVRGRSLVIILRTRCSRENHADSRCGFSKLACVKYKSAYVCNLTLRDLWTTKFLNGCKRFQYHIFNTALTKWYSTPGVRPDRAGKFIYICKVLFSEKVPENFCARLRMPIGHAL